MLGFCLISSLPLCHCWISALVRAPHLSLCHQWRNRACNFKPDTEHCSGRRRYRLSYVRLSARHWAGKWMSWMESCDELNGVSDEWAVSMTSRPLGQEWRHVWATAPAFVHLGWGKTRQTGRTKRSQGQITSTHTAQAQCHRLWRSLSLWVFVIKHGSIGSFWHRRPELSIFSLGGSFRTDFAFDLKT